MGIVMSTKQISWKHEREFRLLYPGDKTCEKGKNIENQHFGIEATDLYIGYNCSEQNKSELINIGNENLFCKIHQASIGKKKFLEFEEINK